MSSTKYSTRERASFAVKQAGYRAIPLCVVVSKSTKFPLESVRRCEAIANRFFDAAPTASDSFPVFGVKIPGEHFICYDEKHPLINHYLKLAEARVGYDEKDITWNDVGEPYVQSCVMREATRLASQDLLLFGMPKKMVIDWLDDLVEEEENWLRSNGYYGP